MQPMSCVFSPPKRRLCPWALGVLLVSYASLATTADATPPLAPELEPRLVPTKGKDNNDYSPSSPARVDPAEDPPARIGRLNAITGVVSLRPAGQTSFDAAQHNRPIAEGDSLFTGRTGRCEMHMGAHVVRLGPNTLLTVEHFDDEQMQLSVPQGVVMVRIRELATGEIAEIDTPNAAMLMQHEGVYRADVDVDGGHLALCLRRGGEADVMVTGESWAMHTDEMVQLELGLNVHHRILPAPAFDELDQWGANRDQSQERSQSLAFVSRNTVGYEDLDANGSWGQTQDFGAIWYPTTVDDDWAPYRDGSWSYIAPWGWSWIDEAAWGFAPFHYGRWVYGGNRWGWAPGALGYAPCYAPALVGFLGGPELGLAGETLAWFPLGWGEAYWPNYRVSYGYVHRVNQAYVNTTHGHQHPTSFANQHVAGAVTAAPVGAVTAGTIIAHNHLHVSAAAQDKATFLGSAPHITASAPNGARAPAQTAAGQQPRASWLGRPLFHASPSFGFVQRSPGATNPTISSGNGTRLAPQAPPSGDGRNSGYNVAQRGGQVYRYPQIYRTPVLPGPHWDPRGSYNRPASGSYNPGAAVYHQAPSYNVPQSSGGYVGYVPVRGPVPSAYNANAGRRYEPVNRSAPAAAPAMHPGFAPAHFGGHFGGHR